METIGHHTCSQDNGEGYVLQNAPFRSQQNEQINKLPFLGSGYYFWEDNFPMAEFWGNVHYNGNYYILEIVLRIEPEKYFDLVGDRAQQKHFEELIKMLQTKLPPQKWKMGYFIELLKKLNAAEPGIFPFEAIRAVDNTSGHKDQKLYFSSLEQKFVILNPKYIICFLIKNEVIFKTKKIVYPEQ